MNRNKTFILTLLSFFMLIACEKEIEISIKASQPKLVINGFVAADSIIDVIIASSKTVFGVDTDFVWIDDAVATLYVDGEEKEQLDTYPIELSDDFIYTYHGIPQPTVGYRTSFTKGEIEKTYMLVVTHPDFETATCETTIPIPQKIIGVSTSTEFYDYGAYSNLHLNFHLTLSDDIENKNYYRIISKSTDARWKTNSDTKDDSTGYISVVTSIGRLSSDDPILNPSETDVNDFLIESPNNYYSIFTDDLISDDTYGLVVYRNYNAWVLENNQLNTHYGEFYSYTIYLHTLSKEAYLYMQSSHAQHWYSDDYFAEPVQAYSNIENGVGIFAGYSASQITITDGEYPVDGVEYKFYQ
ncbi:MAG: DUF4249 domain-containing protein [Prolixibacteraceae bacterium]|nr:DUF4249 domain-containing protein [Prolixibacteraceae bacterium]